MRFPKPRGWASRLASDRPRSNDEARSDRVRRLGRADAIGRTKLSQVLVQPDTRLFTRPVGRACFSKRTYERFDTGSNVPEARDSISERPAGGCVFVQESLFFFNHPGPSQTTAGSNVGQDGRYGQG